MTGPDLLGLEAAHPDGGTKAGAPERREAHERMTHEDAGLADEGNDVGNGGQRDQIEQALKDGLDKELLTPSERRLLRMIGGEIVNAGKS